MPQIFLVAVSAAVILFFQGCTSKVEIPIKHAGVVKNHEQVNDEILKPGEHLVSFGSKVIVYDVRPASLDIEFDFLFSDVSRGDVKLAIEFSPVVDSLAIFYRKYQSIYVSAVIDQGTRKVVRDLCFKYRPTDLTKHEFELEMSKAIRSNRAIVNYVEIRNVDVEIDLPK